MGPWGKPARGPPRSLPHVSPDPQHLFVDLTLILPEVSCLPCVSRHCSVPQLHRVRDPGTRGPRSSFGNWEMSAPLPKDVCARSLESRSGEGPGSACEVQFPAPSAETPGTRQRLRHTPWAFGGGCSTATLWEARVWSCLTGSK